MPSRSAVSSYQTNRFAIQRFRTVIEIGFVALLAWLLLWKGVLPGWRVLNTDFSNYYVVARLIREHYCLDRIYDWIWLQRVADRFGVGHQAVSFLGLTPFSALPVFPFTWLPVLEAKRIWMLLNAAMLVGSVYFLSRETGIGHRKAWLIALLTVLPLRNSFLLGQMHLLVLALLTAGYIFHMRNRQVASGCCMALASALKIYPVFFCLYFIAKRRWRSLASLLACGLTCLLLSYLLVGKTAMNLYLLQQLPRSLQGESAGPFTLTSTSAAALFHHLFTYEPELNPHPFIMSPLAYSIFYPLWQATLTSLVLARLRTRFVADDRETLEWSMFLCMLMFLSSNPATYQYVAMIAAGVATLAVLIRRNKNRLALEYLGLYVLACNMTVLLGLHKSGVHILAVVVLKLAIGLAMLVFYSISVDAVAPVMNVRFDKIFSFRLKMVILLICIWLIGARSAWSHSKDLCSDCFRRVEIADDSYSRTQPQQGAAELSYIAMTPAGYRAMQGDKPISRLHLDDPSILDEFSLSTIPRSDGLWIEEAGELGSKITSVSPLGKRVAGCEIRGAESPTMSADGSVLAFLREDHGHGSLWFVDSGYCAKSNAKPRRLTSSAYDVRSAGVGSSNQFLFSAVDGGKERIFQVSPGGSPRMIVEGEGDLEFPAMNSGGTRLIMRELIRSRWQLVSMDFSSNVKRQLTFADCNAFTPSWKDDDTVIYATDCERGVGLTAIAWIRVSP